MELKRFVAIEVVAMTIALGVFFSFFLGAVVSQGGRATLDMTMFNEMWIEYWLMVAVMGTLPWALWYLTKE